MSDPTTAEEGPDNFPNFTNLLLCAKSKSILSANKQSLRTIFMRLHAAGQQPRVHSSCHANFNRRGFICAAALGTAGMLVNPAKVLAEGSTGKEAIFKKLSALFDELVTLRATNSIQLSIRLNDFRKFIRDNYSEFLEWYEKEVNNKTQGKNFHQRQIVLEAIGKRIINDHSEPGQEALPLESSLITSYSTLIENNNSSRYFISSALDAVNILIGASGCPPASIDAGDVISETLNLFTTVMKGVSKLPGIDDALKVYMFEILVSCANTYEANLQAKLLNSTIKDLAENFFGLKKFHNDTEGVHTFIGTVTRSQEPQPTQVTSPIHKINIPPVFLYLILNTSPGYFESAANCLTQKMDTLLTQRNPDSNELALLITQGVDFLRFFSPSTLTSIQGTTYYSESQDLEFVPEMTKEKREEIQRWAEEKIAKPVEDTFLSCLQNKRATKVTVEDKELPGGGSTERHIEDKTWRLVNSHVKIITRCRQEGFPRKVFDITLERLRDGNPYEKEKAYETIGAVMPDHKTGRKFFDCFYTMPMGVMSEDSPQAVRGIAHSCAELLEDPSLADSRKQLFKLLEQVNSKGKKPTDINQADLTPVLKLIVDSVLVIFGDVRFAMSLMPERRFPPPTIKRVGDKEVIEYSKENIEDGEALKRLWHNSFLFLAYLARYHGSSDQQLSAEAKSLKQAICKFLEDKLRFNLTELDGLDYAEHWGEKIGALMDLYKSMHDVVKEGEGFLQSREEALAGLLFEEESNKGNIYGKGKPLFQLFTEGIEDYALSEAGSRTGITLSGLTIGSRNYNERVEEIKRLPEYKEARSKATKQLEILKAKVVAGMLDVAGHRGLVEQRVHLHNIGNKIHFANGMLRDPRAYTKALYGVTI